jgi:hypothetical protein
MTSLEILDPRQCAPLPADLVALPRQVLFTGPQRFARLCPLLSRNCRMLGGIHRLFCVLFTATSRILEISAAQPSR